jgi:hypothetical protein
VTFRTINAAIGDHYQGAEDYEAAIKGGKLGDKPYLTQEPGQTTPSVGFPASINPMLTV